MTEISAKDVKALRDATGAGMMDAKRALVEVDGDFGAATQLLREKGLAKAATRSDRDNVEGAVSLATGDGRAALVHLKCETDFSAKSEGFLSLANEMVEAVLTGGEAAVEALAPALDDLRLAVKENVELGEVRLVEASADTTLDTYLHLQDGRG
ncbi:MAG TPA: translation elongation factor Ts, partial [Acidimicrobiaceae bacterium]|nr:translation elongation factor Ts [Acidimicrobiaceae bacterium]